MLVVTGEFGRTPRINGSAGRDHWGPLCTLALAGGGLRMGQAVGDSSERAEVPRTNPIYPKDLMATIFHVPTQGISPQHAIPGPKRPAHVPAAGWGPADRGTGVIAGQVIKMSEAGMHSLVFLLPVV